MRYSIAMMKPNNTEKHENRRFNRTGEDIDMLNEDKTDPESGSDGSVSYKDNYDGA